MRYKLTKKQIDGFTFIDSGKKDIRWDEEISGFGLRVYPSGKKSFILSYRHHSTKRLFTIGQYGKITLDQARDLARKRLGEIADDRDPLVHRKAAKKKHTHTVQNVFNEFLKKYAKVHTKTWGQTERIFKKDVLPAIGHLPVEEVTRSHIVEMLDEIMARHADIMANRTLAAVKKFFAWCVERGLIAHSPTYPMSLPAPIQSRDRVLGDDELVEIWNAAQLMAYPFGSMLQFLILTGQRRGEAAGMRWQDIDLKRKVWTLEQDQTKSKRRHEVPLSPLALKLLKQTPKLGGFVFSSSGHRPFENFSRGKKEISRIMKQKRAKQLPDILPWTVHDIRRSAASGMARLKTAPHIIEKILNHSTGSIRGVAAIYNRYQYEPEKREALELWAKHMQKMLDAASKRPKLILD